MGDRPSSFSAKRKDSSLAAAFQVSWETAEKKCERPENMFERAGSHAGSSKLLRPHAMRE